MVGCFLEDLGETALADVITLKSGKKVEGLIVQETDKLVKIEIGLGVPVTYFQDDIEKIEKKPFDVKATQKAARPTPSPASLPLITRPEVEKFIEGLEAAFGKNDETALKSLIGEKAPFVFRGENDSRESFTRDEYLQLISSNKNIATYRYESDILSVEIKDNRAIVEENVKETMTLKNHQVIETTSRRRSLYSKLAGGKIISSRSEIRNE